MEYIYTDVLVIGAGAAGIRAALAASEAGVDVLLIAKAPVTRGGSTFSPISKGWGIQALVGGERTDQNLEAFYDDIIRVGLGRCDPVLVSKLVGESGARLEDLVSWGMRFRKDNEGYYVRSKGCFSIYERAFLTGSFENIKQTFTSALDRFDIKTMIGAAADLTTVDGICRGAWILGVSGEIYQINADSTILATGGGAGIFNDHLVGNEDVGDGYVLAHRAGAKLRNMEFIQFMLGLKQGTTRRFLPLSWLNKDAVLVDKWGRNLFNSTAWNKVDLDQVLTARKSHFPFSCRDVSGLVDVAVAAQHLKRKKVWWKDHSEKHTVSREEIVHFAHAFNGGIRIDPSAESTVPGLFAAGEVATGPHGADRIGGCMMTATQVFGERAGRFAAQRARAFGRSKICGAAPPEYVARMEPKPGNTDNEISCKIELAAREALSRFAGVLRSKEGLEKCHEKLDYLEQELEEVGSGNRIPFAEYLRLRNMILTGTLVTHAALERKESLGSHFRMDFPPTNYPIQ